MFDPEVLGRNPAPAACGIGFRSTLQADWSTEEHRGTPILIDQISGLSGFSGHGYSF